MEPQTVLVEVFMEDIHALMDLRVSLSQTDTISVCKHFDYATVRNISALWVKVAAGDILKYFLIFVPRK